MKKRKSIETKKIKNKKSLPTYFLSYIFMFLEEGNIKVKQNYIFSHVFNGGGL